MSSTEKKITYDLSPALHYPQAGKQGFTQAVTSGDTEQAGLEAEPESPVPSQQTDMGTLISCTSMVSLCRQHLQRPPTPQTLPGAGPSFQAMTWQG